MNTRILASCVSLMGLSAGPSMAAVANWWSPYTTDANTLGLWHFDDVTGPTSSFIDSGPGVNNGALTTNTGGITLTTTSASGAGTGPGAGLFGKSLDFSPSSLPLPNDASVLNWGSVPDDNTDMEINAGGLAGRMTIEAWVKPSSYDISAGEVYFVGKRTPSGSWNFGLVGGKLFFDAITTAGGGAYSYALAPTALTAGNWTHVAAVYYENETEGWDDHIHLYVNGTEVADKDWYTDSGVSVPGGSMTENNDPLIFGNRGTSTAFTIYNGQIDEVRYSNVAREFGPAVPEPTSLSLLALGGLAMLRRRRIA